MATITKPMALDESFNTTESTPRSQADVLAGIESAIRQGFGRSAADVSYDNTTSGLTADDVQEAIDELADEKVNKVAGKGLSTNDYTDEDKEALDNMELDIAGTKTVSGNPLTLTDAAPINAESLVVELEPKQDLHGQSAPYVGGAGKNKLPMTVEGIKAANTEGTWSGNSYTIYGVTFTIQTDDGGNVTGIDYSGTPSANPGYAAMYIVNGVELPSGNYILNGGVSNNAFLDTSLSGSYVTSKGGDTPIVVSGSAAYVRAVVEGNTAYSGTLLPMIRLSTETDPTFAPYSNICPITGYTECDVDDVGKNLLNPSTVTLQRYLQSDGGVGIDGGSDWSYTDYIKIEAGEIYSLSGVSNMGTVAKHCFYDENKNFISSINTTEYIFTAPANAKFVRLSNRTLNYSSVMLEKSNQPTAFEPYHSSNATIQFGQTVYGGSVNFKTGVVTVKYGFNDLGDNNYYKINNYPNLVYTMDLRDNIYEPTSVHDVRSKCEGYRPMFVDYWENNGSITVGYLFTPKGVNICDSRFVDKSTTEIKAMLSGIKYCYELATPFTIQLTPDELRLLKGTNNITTNGTTIALGYQPDNVIGEVKGEIEKCAVDAEFMQFTDGTDTFTDVNLSLDAYVHTVSVVGSKIEQKRFICFEVMDKMGGALQGILASCIAFTDGANTPSGTAFRAYIESLQMYVNFRIYGSGGSYTLVYQSESSFSASAFYVRVRMMNNL